jgi:tripartite-type tricarboxylate transporter receptor subunit TctC
LLRASALIAASWLLGFNVQAQRAFPSRVIKIVVPYSAGTGSDALARTIAQCF